jgi:hypothetical protein
MNASGKNDKSPLPAPGIITSGGSGLILEASSLFGRERRSTQHSIPDGACEAPRDQPHTRKAA